MSFEYLCQRCGQGRFRPIQFSYDEAILTCDNEDCDSHLDVSPWSCVINHNISQVHLPASNQRHIQHWSRSSSSSSGIQSDVRSPGFSPARSFDSVTDREVENLLHRYINARPKTTSKNPVSCPKTSGEKGTSELNNFASFFELLDGLDLESTDQQSSKGCLPVTAPSVSEDTKFDPVCCELESWMKGFESPMPSHNKDPSQNFDAKHTESAAIKDSLNNRLYIPSRSSAFSQVSPKNDSGQSNSSCSLVNSDAGVTERNPERSIAAVEKTFDQAKNCLLNEANFLSPATSVVSDDSGYDDAGLKINSMLLLPSSAIPNLGKKATCEKKNVLPGLRSRGWENSGSSEPKINVLPTSASPRPFTQPSVVMNEVESSNANPDEKGDLCSVTEFTEQNDIKPAVNTSGTLCDSSQFNDSISPSKTESSGSSKLFSAKTSDKSASTLQEPTSNSDSSQQTKASELCQVKPPPAKKSGRPRGRPRRDLDTEPPKRVSKRRRVPARKEESSPGSASLSKGLASVLQTPAFYVRKDEAHHHNIATLSFRNRLNGSFVEDPWSVPELHLEELSIEIVVQGQRNPPIPQKESKTSFANPEETQEADSSRLLEDSKKEAVCLENEKIDASSPGSDILDRECLNPSTRNVGLSSPKDSDSCLKEGYDRLEHLDSDSESDDGSSDDSSSESCATKDSEIDSIVKLFVPYSNSSVSNTDENSSGQKLKICDKRSCPSEKDQEKCLVCDETGKQTLENFDDALSRCSPSRRGLIDNSLIVKIKEENNVGDLPSGQMIDNSHPVNIKVGENNIGDLPSGQIIWERESSNIEIEIDTSVTSTCVGDGELSGDESKMNERDKSMEFLDLPLSVSPSLSDINVKDALHCSELPPTKEIESKFDSFLDTSFALNLSNLHETDSCVLDFASVPKIRSWMRHKESKPVMVKKENIETDVPETSPSCGEERKMRGQSSDYFSTLLEDLDFQEEFFQCPTTENLSSTFGEHLSSSLFFGETACSSTSTSVERALVCGSSASVCTSVPGRSSVFTTVTTVISPTNMPVSNVSCSLESISGTVPQSGVHPAVSIGRISSAASASTSVTQSLYRAIPSIQDISSLPPSASSLIKDKISSNRLLSREKDVIGNPINEKVPSGVGLIAKNVSVEQESAEGLRSQNGCGKDEVLRDKPLRIKQEPTSTKYVDTEEETSGNSFNSKASTSADMLDAPFISIDSDDEIQIIMPNEKSLTGKSTNTKSFGQKEDIPELRDSKFDCLAPASYTSEHPSLLPLGASKEASHKEVGKGKKLKDRTVSQRELETKDRCSFYNKTGVGKGSSAIQKGSLMCGILDNSVVHDPSCFSPNAKGFVEFEENLWSEKPPENINFYFGSKKTNFKLCEDLKVNCNTQSKTPQEQVDEITLSDRHLGSPDRSSIPFTFDVGSKFGCTKSSPQHKLLMSPASEDSSIEKMVLDGKNLGFFCYDSSSETCSSSSSDEGDGKYDSETSVSTGLFSSSTKKFALKMGNPSFSPTNEDHLNTSFYDGSGEESETDREFFSRKPRMLNRGLLGMDSADSDLGLFKKPQMRFKRKFDSSFSSECPSELKQQSLLKMASLSCIPVEPPKKKVAAAQHKLPIGRKFMSTPLHNPLIQSSEKLLSTPKMPKRLCPSTVPVNNTLNQKCNFSKSNISTDALANANLLHHPFVKHTMPSNTSIVKPSFCHSTSASSSFLSSTKINCVASSSTTSLKSPSFIDCQMPSVSNSSVIIPPALRTSYAPVQDGTRSVFKDAGSSNKVINMQEKLIVIKKGPVMKVLRVNVIPNSTVKPQDSTATGVSGSGTQQPSTSQTPKPKLNPPKPKLNLASNSSDCSERERTPKDSSSEETKKELLTKVRIGANGKFYVRPTFAMMQAISEMRKTKDQDDSLSEDPKVDCVELPDGIPISHPFQIPSERSLKHLYKDYNKKVSKANKKRRKRKKKYILQRIQNLVKEKVQETVTRSKDEIPEMVAVFIGGKLHIYSRDVDRRSAQ